MHGGKREGAGRPKGSRNRRSTDIQARLDELGIDPIEGMALIAANRTDELGIKDDVPLNLRAQMYKELAPYVAYRLKAVEMSVEPSDAPTEITVRLVSAD